MQLSSILHRPSNIEIKNNDIHYYRDNTCYLCSSDYMVYFTFLRYSLSILRFISGIGASDIRIPYT